MSAQITVSLSTTSIPSSTASLADFQTATGYRELAEQAAANAATHAAQAKTFAEQGQSELARVNSLPKRPPGATTDMLLAPISLRKKC